MKNLIEEIEKEKFNELITYYESGYNDGLDKAINILNQYNISKNIKLSEIMNKLNLAFPKIIKEEKVIRIYNGKALILNIIDNKLQPINVQPYIETKWLYTLWIAGTEIVDDLKESE